MCIAMGMGYKTDKTIIEYYISVTDEPEHLIPSQESPQGSPPLDFQPLSFEGEFKLVYITLRAATAQVNQSSTHRSLINLIDRHMKKE